MNCTYRLAKISSTLLVCLLTLSAVLPRPVFSREAQPAEMEYNFEPSYLYQYYDLDPAKSRFVSQQTIDLINTSQKNLHHVCFLFHSTLTIETMSLKDSSGKALPIKQWKEIGTEKIYGKYDVPVICLETEEIIEPDQKISFFIEYGMKPEAIKNVPENMYEFTVSPKASYAVFPLAGNTPYFGGSTSCPYTIKIKYPAGNLTCVPGDLISSKKEGGYIIDTYEHTRPNVPVFSCAPYRKVKRENEQVAVEYYLYPTESYSEKTADEMFKVIDLYFETFGDNGTRTYKFATVGKYNSQRMQGENKGSTIYFPDIVSGMYGSGVTGRYDYVEFLSHEVYHNWNLFYVRWKGPWAEWFLEGGANFICAWASGKILGDEAGIHIRKKLLTRFIKEKGFESIHTLRDAEKNSNAERVLMYDYGALVWQQLGRKMGMDALLAGLRDFYDQHRFQEVRYENLVNSLRKFTDLDVASFLDPWINNNAKITLKIGAVDIENQEGRFFTHVDITTDAAEDFEINTSLGFKTKADGKMNRIPVCIDAAGKKSVTFSSKQKPVYIEIDPDYLVPRINLVQTVWGARGD